MNDPDSKSPRGLTLVELFLLVCEPAIYGDRRFILQADGQILEEDWLKEYDSVAGEKTK